jgi:hypothetical protein
MSDRPFKNFTLPMLYAYIAKSFGLKALDWFFSREAFDLYHEHRPASPSTYPVGWKEPHLEAAKELKKLGLVGVAEICVSTPIRCQVLKSTISRIAAKACTKGKKPSA